MLLDECNNLFRFRYIAPFVDLPSQSNYCASALLKIKTKETNAFLHKCSRKDTQM